MTLPAGTKLGHVTLGVADVDRSATFYRDLVGLQELQRSADSLTLGSAGVAVLHLIGEAGAKPPPRRTTGLFHTAILFPDRHALARVVKHIATNGYAFTGASDHLVSEAFYLDDPDGLGVELYRDRPRAEWPFEDGALAMGTLPLDVSGVLADADGPFDGAPDGTRVGHVHLKVSDIATAESFYRDEIGFEITARYGDSATFLAADGYHHHLGTNVWQSAGASPAPAGHAGLREFVIVAPGLAARTVVDPWGHRIQLR
ncbi:MAG TPA: VOC family protein [Gemmatimonadaceae bacterium]|nr:VOC family protein [Gemmatimonadaceae bacterium]